MFFAFVGVPIWPTAVVGVRTGGSVAQAITNYQQGACIIAKARYVVGVANATKHNTQQRQSAQNTVYFLLVLFGSCSRHVWKLSKLYRSIPEQVPNKMRICCLLLFVTLC
jgi:hypothetical protein